MGGRFVHLDDVQREELDWGSLGWISRPTSTGARQLTVIDVRLEPGEGHDFHVHPGQEEVILVEEGQIEQWLETESSMLSPGESIFIEPDTVHGSFNTGSATARLTVVLGPSLGEDGYVLVDVSGDEPWSTLR
jgi:quercetin dioxygenase-like cupin family protein